MGHSAIPAAISTTTTKTSTTTTTTTMSKTHATPMPARPEISPLRAKAEPVAIPSARTLQISHSRQKHASDFVEMAPRRSRTVNGGGRDSSDRSSMKTGRSTHDPNSLPPAVAALLAMTTIPPRRPQQRRRRRPEQEPPVSIEELVSSWKSDDSLRSTSYGSPNLSMLLEDADDDDESIGQSRRPSGLDEEGYFNVRSSSSESMPSLEADDRSVLSFNSLATPDSLRSRRSISTLRKDKQRSVPAVEECPLNHPLAPPSDDDEEGEEEDVLQLSLRSKPSKTRKATSSSSFKSNLTLSLQSLKNAALSSISSLRSSSNNNNNNSTTTTTSPPPSRNPSSTAHLDDMLWSHPFLFPRFSSEVRPASPEHSQKSSSSKSTSKSAKQSSPGYLNPMPLTFEEQEAPFQKALHEPYLLEGAAAEESSSDDMPPATIQMRTYTSRQQSRRAAKSSRRPAAASPDPNSEAGRALLGAPPADAPRTREVRENSDFLRIVVMEMNMRRLGKLESAGRAKIWLPPREAASSVVASGGGSPAVPRRWVGVSAY
jgi:hypothetical protein